MSSIFYAGQVEGYVHYFYLRLFFVLVALFHFAVVFGQVVYSRLQLLRILVMMPKTILCDLFILLDSR